MVSTLLHLLETFVQRISGIFWTKGNAQKNSVNRTLMADATSIFLCIEPKPRFHNERSKYIKNGPVNLKA